MWKSAEFWVAVSFLCFMALLLKMKLPAMITSGLDARADAIRKELDEARRLREEAQELLADYQRKRRQADEEAQAIVEQARKEAEAMKAESKRTLDETITRRKRLAEEKIARAEAQAVADVRAAAVEAATSVAERVLAQQAGGEIGHGLVDQSIRDIKSRFL